MSSVQGSLKNSVLEIDFRLEELEMISSEITSEKRQLKKTKASLEKLIVPEKPEVSKPENEKIEGGKNGESKITGGEPKITGGEPKITGGEPKITTNKTPKAI